MGEYLPGACHRLFRIRNWNVDFAVRIRDRPRDGEMIGRSAIELDKCQLPPPVYLCHTTGIDRHPALEPPDEDEAGECERGQGRSRWFRCQKRAVKRPTSPTIRTSRKVIERGRSEDTAVVRDLANTVEVHQKDSIPHAGTADRNIVVARIEEKHVARRCAPRQENGAPIQAQLAGVVQNENELIGTGSVESQITAIAQAEVRHGVNTRAFRQRTTHASECSGAGSQIIYVGCEIGGIGQRCPDLGDRRLAPAGDDNSRATCAAAAGRTLKIYPPVDCAVADGEGSRIGNTDVTVNIMITGEARAGAKLNIHLVGARYRDEGTSKSRQRS
jgi:hypothetical protein